jgi:myo-inositol-1(or 4)-monophosphatase
LGTGFPVRHLEALDLYLMTFRALFPMTSGIRRAGAAALDLAYVACGRLDGFWELGLKEWDMAAGTLLILEAGGMVNDTEGGTNYLQTGNIVAGTPKVLKEMLKTIAPFRAPTW